MSLKVLCLCLAVAARGEPCADQSDSCEAGVASSLMQGVQRAQAAFKTVDAASVQQAGGSVPCRDASEECPHNPWYCTNWRKENCCVCGGGVTHQLEATADQDTLSVMTFNTYLLRVKIVVDYDVRPNLEQRAKDIDTWFRTLKSKEVPDVVVLQEIYSDEGELLMRLLCNDKWRRNSGVFWHSHGKVIECNKPGSPFGHATPNANPTSDFNVVKSSGTAVLVKKGNPVLAAKDQVYKDTYGEESFTRLGFWAVEFYKGTQKYWFFGTHATAWETDGYRETRHKQFEQLRRYIDDQVESRARVAIAGDMNIFVAPFVTLSDGVYTRHTPDEPGKNELERMLATLGGDKSTPATAGTLIPLGFWLPLDVPLNASADPVRNHFLTNIDSEVKLGSQMYDWVLAPGMNDPKGLVTPVAMRHQIVPVKAETCYKSDQPGAKGTLADDLSDHFSVFAELRYTETAPNVVAVSSGHRGTGPTFPAGPYCQDDADTTTRQAPP